MSRQPSDPSARLALLRDALDKTRAELKGKKGDARFVNADEMAAIAGITWKAMKPQVEADPKWPVQRKGSEGVAYLFAPVKVLEHMIAGLEAKLAQREERAARIARMSGVAVAPAQASLDVRELKAIDDLQTSVQRRKIEQGFYVKRADHEATVADIFSTMQAETLATVSRLDPAGRWPATVRVEVADAMRTLLVRLHDKIGAKLKPDDSGPTRPGRSRARAARR